MKITTALPILAVLALSSPAFAQMGPPPGGGPGMGPGMGQGMGQGMGMGARHDEMCANHYAHAVGKLAEIEVRLNLTPAQKPLFNRWKDIKLSQAKAFSAKCGDFKPLGPDASLVDHRNRQIDRLEQRLAGLKAETPSFDALVKTLSPEQQQVLKRAAMEIIGDRMEKMGRFGDRMGGMHQRVIERRIQMRTDQPPPPSAK
jgi:hypothetical protein